MLLLACFPELKVVPTGIKTPVVTRGHFLQVAETETCRKPNVFFLSSRDYARFIFFWFGVTVSITSDETSSEIMMIRIRNTSRRLED